MPNATKGLIECSEHRARNITFRMEWIDIELWWEYTLAHTWQNDVIELHIARTHLYIRRHHKLVQIVCTMTTNEPKRMNKAYGIIFYFTNCHNQFD